MAFADIAKSHATFIAGHVFGELIEYRAWPASAWTSNVKAQVTRSPPDAIGVALANTINVFISKADVAKVHVGKDNVRLTADKKPGEIAPTYVVTQVLQESSGSWSLSCVR